MYRRSQACHTLPYALVASVDDDTTKTEVGAFGGIVGISEEPPHGVKVGNKIK